MAHSALRTAAIMLTVMSLLTFPICSNLFASLAHAATPDFTVTASPSSLSIVGGYSATASIEVASLNGFSGTVALSAPRQGSCDNATFAPASVFLGASGMANSTLTISTYSYMCRGSGQFNVTATSGTLVREAPLFLAFTQPAPTEDFELSLDPQTVAVTAGQTLNVSRILVTSIGHLDTLVWFWEPGGASTARGYLGVDYWPDYVVAAPNRTLSGVAIIYTTLDLTAGTYILNLTAYTNLDGPKHTVWLTLDVKPAPLSLTLVWAVFRDFLLQVMGVAIWSGLGLLFLGLAIARARKSRLHDPTS